MAVFGAVARHGTAQEEAYQALLTSIRRGVHRPGERLVPEVIARQLDMSRMPVREAMQRLATEGLVQLRPNRGCVVSVLSIDEIVEVFEIRSVLEGLAVRLAMPRVDSRVIAELEHYLDLMARAESAGGDDWFGHHQSFHEHICALSGRPKLIRQISALHMAIEPYMRVWLHHIDKPSTGTRAQHVVVDAVRTGDAVFAEQAMRDHILRTTPRLVEFLERENGAGVARQRQSLEPSPV